jgi:hypothetical protein
MNPTNTGVREVPLTGAHRRLRPVIGGVALAALLTGMVVLAPSASASFTQPYSASPSGYDSFSPRVSFDRQADAVYVWVRESHTYPYPQLVQMRSRSSAGTWSSAVNVSSSGAVRGPKIALDDDGDGIVVWQGYDGANWRVNARRVSRTGALGSVKVLSPAGVHATGTDVAIDSDGDAVVTWAELDTTGASRPKMRRYTRAGELPTAVVLASSPTWAETPAVAIDREGDAVLTWTNNNVEQARTLSAAGTLSGLKTVSGNVSPVDRHFTAKVTVDRDGDALLTWKHWTAADQTEQVWGRWLSRYGTIGSLRQLTPSSHTAISNYSIASDLDGDRVLTWDLFPSKYLYARTISSTATIGSYVRLTTYGRMHTVRLDDDGDGVVVYEGQGINGSVGSIRARRVSRSGTFATAQVIAESGVSPVTAVSPGGRAIVGWERRFSVDLRVQSSVGP